MTRTHRIKTGCMLVLSILMAVLPVAGAQKDGGFGKFGKKDVSGTTYLSPKVLVYQSTYSSDVSGAAATPEIREQITNAIESVLKRVKPDIRRVPEKGELRVFVSVTTFNIQRQVDSKNGNTKVFITFRANYRVEDWSSGSPITLDTDDVQYSEKKGKGGWLSFGSETPPPDPVLQQQAIDQLIDLLKGRVEKSEEQFKAYLADVEGKKLLPGNAFAEAGQWERAREIWSALQPFESPKADSYRLYSLGLADEMLGYKTFRDNESVESALKALELFKEAKGYYEKALENNPEEKVFRKTQKSLFTRKELAQSPLARVDEAIAVYSQWTRFKRAEAVTVTAPPPAPTAAPAKPSKKKKPRRKP